MRGPQFIIKTQLCRVLHHQARPLQELSFETHSRGGFSACRYCKALKTIQNIFVMWRKILTHLTIGGPFTQMAAVHHQVQQILATIGFSLPELLLRLAHLRFQA